VARLGSPKDRLAVSTVSINPKKLTNKMCLCATHCAGVLPYGVLPVLAISYYCSLYVSLRVIIEMVDTPSTASTKDVSFFR
jgi:hypothetical protein